MKNSRRNFIKFAGLAGIGMAGSKIPGIFPDVMGTLPDELSMENLSVIGLYGPWAASLTENRLPSLSFRNPEWTDAVSWQTAARKRLAERLAIPDIGGVPKVSVRKKYIFDGLQVEELSWQLPYGRPTDALVLKPVNATGRLPGILAFHDHGANKYFGTRKITRTGDDQHPVMQEYQKNYYGGRAWANEAARRGYVVLVSDAFPFASRRVMLQDVPEHLRNGFTDENPEDPANITNYNDWASDHEDIMAKSLFSAGTTWPGVFFAEDRKALDVLCGRDDVDPSRIGCGGLSGGGMRTVFMGGLEPRIKCAVCVGFMTTWRDFALNKSFTHTWMAFVPLLPNELDFPEILGLRVPNATLVLNDLEDDLYSIEGMKDADRILGEVYRKAGVAEGYRCSFYAGEHKFDKNMQEEAFDWFDRWLK